MHAGPTAGHGAVWNSAFSVPMPPTSRCVPHPKPLVSVCWGPGRRFLLSRSPQILASPAKADSASCGATPPGTLQLAGAPADKLGLTVNTGTSGCAVDRAVTPRTPSKASLPAVVVNDAADVDAPVPFTFTCRDDITAVDLHTGGSSHISIDKVEWDYDMKQGQLQTLTAPLWRKIMGTFGINPPVQEANVLVLEWSSMSTPFTTSTPYLCNT